MTLHPALAALGALVVLVGCSGGGRTTEDSIGATSSTSAGTTTEGTTLMESSNTEVTTGIGTTFDPKPSSCADDSHISCTPPYIDSTTGTGTGSGTTTDTDTDTGTTGAVCDPYYVELEDTAKGNCSGDFKVIDHQVSWQGACCITYACAVTHPEAKACIPLAHASGCKDSLPGVPWFEVCGNLGYLKEPFVDGDLCCAYFGCYCGDTG